MNRLDLERIRPSDFYRMERNFEGIAEDRESSKRDDREEDRQEDMDIAMRKKRHPGDFDYWPSDEQMEYFKRGGR